MEAGARVGIAEMLLSGTTSFLDLYYFEDAVARAVESLGIRGFLGWAVLDPELTTQKGVPVDNARAFIGRWKDHPRVSPLVAPQGVYVCGKETWLRSREVADAAGTLVHYHLSETRKEVHEHQTKTASRPVLWLEEIGFLGPHSVAAHAVWLTGKEIELLAGRGVGIAHCPSSNLKLASGGVAPIVELLGRGSHRRARDGFGREEQLPLHLEGNAPGGSRPEEPTLGCDSAFGDRSCSTSPPSTGRDLGPRDRPRFARGRKTGRLLPVPPRPPVALPGTAGGDRLAPRVLGLHGGDRCGLCRGDPRSPPGPTRGDWWKIRTEGEAAAETLSSARPE